ncbi:DUF4321 domain-containing protein [Paenibacillus sp. J2TS4]|uniref:DUF4321 domain-containing protein n=1 Tax=Paenibacillus sp. J2TS4 TaxID=2807194 RepID=UPI001B2D040E|nr:DUF4321 domain-containing protein [Paenibacillus sp. J2TS4]GIP31360.1 hypothetical protein J2TS4_05700 [Paenibacillus sp. J2TS4]
MKKNTLTLILFLLIGLIAGAIITQLLAPVQALSFLTKSADIVWQPKADLQIIKYDLYFQIKLNLVSILGIVLAIWIYRKL